MKRLKALFSHKGTGHGDVSLFKTGALNDTFDDKLGHYLPEEDCDLKNGVKSSILISDYNANLDNNDAIPPVDLTLLPCNICGRTFQHESLAKHAIICQKTSNKKRKKFDSSRQRRQGTDLAQFLPKNFGLPENSPFIEKEKTPSLSKMPVKKHSPRNNGPSKLFSTPENSKCPHCGRGFGARAFDRHVAWCAERTRLANAPGANEVRIARSRLMARTTYKAPPVRTRRSLTREKYSLSRSASVDSAVSDRSSNGIENRRLTDGPQHLPVIMKTPKHNDKEPLMTRSLTKPRFDDNYDPFLSAKRQMMDLMSSSTNIHKLDSSPNDYRKESISFRSTNPIPHYTRDESSIISNSSKMTHSPHFQRSRSLRNPPNKYNFSGRLVATKLPNKSTSSQLNNNTNTAPNRTNKESPKIKNTNIRSDNKNKSMSYESSPFPNRTEKHRLIKLEPVDNITSDNYKNNNLLDSTSYKNNLSDSQENFIDPRLINDKIPPSVQKLLDNPVLLSSTESLLCDNPSKLESNRKAAQKYKENQLNSDEGSSTPTIDDLSAQYDKIMISLEKSMTQVSTQDEDSLYNELEQLMSSLDDKPSNLNAGSLKKNSTKSQIKNSVDGLSNIKKSNVSTKPKEVPYNKSISLNFSSVLNNPLPNPVYPIYSRSHTVHETQNQERKVSTKAIDKYRENESQLEDDIMQSLKDIDVMCEKGSYNNTCAEGNVTAKKKNSAKIIIDSNKAKKSGQERKLYSRESSPSSKYSSKYIGDSAYGRNSLNRSSPSNRIVFRRSPSHKENSPIISRHPTADGDYSTHSPIRDRDYASPFTKDADDQMWVDGQLSSSGSDASLSNVTHSLSRTSSTIISTTRMSKFCHDCGSKFPFETAKFCIECGTRRLAV